MVGAHCEVGTGVWVWWVLTVRWEQGPGVLGAHCVVELGALSDEALGSGLSRRKKTPPHPISQFCWVNLEIHTVQPSHFQTGRLKPRRRCHLRHL